MVLSCFTFGTQKHCFWRWFYGGCRVPQALAMTGLTGQALPCIIHPRKSRW